MGNDPAPLPPLPFGNFPKNHLFRGTRASLRTTTISYDLLVFPRAFRAPECLANLKIRMIRNILTIRISLSIDHEKAGHHHEWSVPWLWKIKEWTLTWRTVLSCVPDNLFVRLRAEYLNVINSKQCSVLLFNVEIMYQSKKMSCHNYASCCFVQWI